MSDSLQPHVLQHTSLLYLSLSLRVCSNLCPLSQRCCLTISSSSTLFFFCLQTFPASGSFPKSLLASVAEVLEMMYMLVTQWCLLCNTMNCSPPGSSVHRILQARILEWVGISFSRGSSRPRNWTVFPAAPALAGGLFTTEPPGKPSLCIPSTFGGRDGFDVNRSHVFPQGALATFTLVWGGAKDEGAKARASWDGASLLFSGHHCSIADRTDPKLMEQ